MPHVSEQARSSALELTLERGIPVDRASGFVFVRRVVHDDDNHLAGGTQTHDKLGPDIFVRIPLRDVHRFDVPNHDWGFGCGGKTQDVVDKEVPDCCTGVDRNGADTRISRCEFEIGGGHVPAKLVRNWVVVAVTKRAVVPEVFLVRVTIDSGDELVVSVQNVEVWKLKDDVGLA